MKGGFISALRLEITSKLLTFRRGVNNVKVLIRSVLGEPLMTGQG